MNQSLNKIWHQSLWTQSDWCQILYVQQLSLLGQYSVFKSNELCFTCIESTLITPVLDCFAGYHLFRSKRNCSLRWIASSVLFHRDAVVASERSSLGQYLILSCLLEAILQLWSDFPYQSILFLYTTLSFYGFQSAENLAGCGLCKTCSCKYIQNIFSGFFLIYALWTRQWKEINFYEIGISAFIYTLFQTLFI